jgi:membrane-associated phospholipid phosphatase
MIAAGLILAGAAGPALSQNAETDREVSWRTLFPNILSDQERIWTFPVRLARGEDIAPTLLITGSAVGLIALDPVDSPYFRRTTSLDGFNDTFSGWSDSLAIAAVPAAFYAFGHMEHNSYHEHTALLMGEAVVDTELVAEVVKDIGERVRPREINPHGNFSDTWFDKSGNPIWSNASFPSGHTIAAFSVATVVAHRYRNHKWIPYAAYGAATLVGFSRVANSAHFPSDVFVGAALGYFTTRFVVLR